MSQIVTREQQDLRQPILSIKIRTPHWRFLNFDKPKSEKPLFFAGANSLHLKNPNTNHLQQSRQRKKEIIAPSGCRREIPNLRSPRMPRYNFQPSSVHKISTLLRKSTSRRTKSNPQKAGHSSKRKRSKFSLICLPDRPTSPFQVTNERGEKSKEVYGHTQLLVREVEPGNYAFGDKRVRQLSPHAERERERR